MSGQILSKNDLSKFDRIEADLELILIAKDGKLFNKLKKQLKEALISSFDDKRADAINEALDYLNEVSHESFSDKDAQKINIILRKNLGDDLEGVLQDNINKLSEKLYKIGINDILKPLKISFSFDVSDDEAALILGNQNLFWIGNFYGSQLDSKIDEVLKEYIKGGKTISEVASDFQSKFYDKTDRGYQYFEDLADYSGSKIRELGKVSGFEKAGIEYYQIQAIIDDRTSEICLFMNDKIFPVSDATAYRDTLLGMDNPEDIKDFAPWLGPDEVADLDASDLPPGLSLPPYHNRCRTEAVAFFK
jgi:SPP1 gp7 family putative phage head morphogenesis protein